MIKLYQIKCLLINAWHLRKALAHNWLTDYDSLLLALMEDSLKAAYEFWSDENLEEHNQLEGDQLENLGIAMDLFIDINERYGYSKGNPSKKEIKKAFSFVVEHMGSWWI